MNIDFRIVIEKFVKGGIKAGILAFAAMLTKYNIDTQGIDFDSLSATITTIISVIAGGLFEALRNYLKMKFGWKFL